MKMNRVFALLLCALLASSVCLVMLPFVPMPVYGSTLQNETFEDWNINGWTNSTKATGYSSVSVVAAAKYAGTYGLNATCYNATDWQGYAYIRNTFLSQQHVFASVYVDFATLTLGSDGRYASLFYLSGDSPYWYYGHMAITRNSTGYFWRCDTHNKTDFSERIRHENATPSITTATWYKLTMEAYRNAGAGFVTFWINDDMLVNQTALTNTYSSSIDNTAIGIVTNDCSPTTVTTYYFDSFKCGSTAADIVYSPVPTLTRLWYNSTRAGNITQFATTWTGDTTELSKAWLETNNTGPTVNSSRISMSGYSSSVTYNMTLNGTNGNTVRCQWFANCSSGDETASGTFDIVTTTIATESILYTDGINFRYTDNGTIVKLTGTNTRDWATAAGGVNYTHGIWFTLGTNSEDSDFNATNVGLTLDAMKQWGINVLRSHFSIEWVNTNEGGQLDHMKTFADLCRNRSMFWIIDIYNVNKSTGQPKLPYPPYAFAGDENYIADSTAYTNFMVGLAKNFSSYGNVMYDLFNEPHGNDTVMENWIGTASTLGVAEQTAIAMREFTDQVILIQWGYGSAGGLGSQYYISDWVPLVSFNCSYNFAYSTHNYRDGSDTNWAHEYIALEAQMTTNTYFSLSAPLIIGEIGISVGSDANETAWYTNALQLFNEHNISYLAWTWIHFGTYSSLALTSPWGYVPPPNNRQGVITIAAMHSEPFIMSVGNGTLNNTNYIYSNNAVWSSAWASNQLTVTYTGATQVRIFWNVSDTYPINSTLQCLHSNGTKINATDYYDSTTNLIRLNSTGASTWTIGYSLAYSVTVTITSPINMTYTTATVPVQLLASGGTIDTILWNCTFTNGTVVYANTVYTVVTSMTLGNGSYVFNARANNTLGEWDEATVMFTVAISASSVTIVITSPANMTYTSSSISISMSASGGTIDTIWWNIQFENSSWLYAENQTYTVATSVTIDENVTATLHGYANNTDGNTDEGSVTFTIYLFPNTIGYQLSQGMIAAAGFMAIVMLLGMVYVALEGKDVKYAVMLAVGEVLLLVTMLILSQLAILG